MSSSKKWKKREWAGGSGEFYKWTDAGQELEGKWCGQHDGQFGPNGTIEMADGTRKIFPLHTGLLNQVDDLEEGQEIKIVYLGKKLNPKSGREFKNFELYTATEE